MSANRSLDNEFLGLVLTHSRDGWMGFYDLILLNKMNVFGTDGSIICAKHLINFAFWLFELVFLISIFFCIEE